MGMLRRAAERLGREPERVAVVQADLFDLPFTPRSFASVACHGLLHLFDDPGQVLGILRAQLASGGWLYATSLVAETAVGATMLRLLHRAGEAAAPRRASVLASIARAALSDAVRLRREGCMAFLDWHASPAGPSQ
jgi:ubiquinone/menaquinone biosynthesis C-methylase UbiE